MLEVNAKTIRQLTDPADPLARVDSVGDAVQPAVRGSEVGVGAEDGIILLLKNNLGKRYRKW